MPEPLAPALERLAALLLDDEHLVRAVGAGRRKGLPRPPWRRVDLRYVDLEAGRRLQITEYDETQAFARNVEDPKAAVSELLEIPYGNWHVETVDSTVQLRVTKKGEAQVHTAAKAAPDAPDRRHDRVKERVIDPGAPFLRALGITDADGRVKPTRADKYRQVEEFVRQLGAALDSSGSIEGRNPLRVVDLGCGNAYLTFAAYDYLTRVRGPGEATVEMRGIDVRPKARTRNTAIARELGWGDGLEFEAGEIATADLGTPDILLALHACDTATDDALAQGVRAEVPVVLAAPCCHHDLQTQTRTGATPSPYGLVFRHGILRERLTDMLTDGLRAAILRIAGYRVDVVEFVDSVHTPRNLLIRAVRTGAPAGEDAVREYRALTTDWGVRPELARQLSDVVPELAS